MYKVLFVCKHNAGRSVIAESVSIKHLPQHRFEVASGGSHPTGKINPMVKAYLQDHDLPIPHNYAHSWDERSEFAPDIVVVLCDSLHNEPAPVWLADGLRINWQVDAFPSGYEANKGSLYQHAHKVHQSLERRILRMDDLLRDGMPSALVSERMLELSEM